MRTIKKYFKIIFILIVVLQISSCVNDDEESNSTETSSTEGQIYFRWTQDLNPNVCPTLRAQGFKDNNSMVPDNAEFSTYFGPCKEGFYQAQYDFVDLDSPNTPLHRTFSYALVKPLSGYKRYYSKRVAGYHQPYNRCLDFSLENNLEFFDVKL